MRTRSRVGVLAVVLLALQVAGTDAAQAPPDTEAAASALVPLLKSVRQRLQPRWGAEPGSLPPSPFTGTQTALLAVRIGEKEVNVDPKVKAAIDRLLAWNPKDSSRTEDATLFSHWLDQLRLKAASIPPPGAAGGECDTRCTIDRFTNPSEALGRSQKDREEMRDQLLLDALTNAVAELDR